MNRTPFGAQDGTARGVTGSGASRMAWVVILIFLAGGSLLLPLRADTLEKTDGTRIAGRLTNLTADTITMLVNGQDVRVPLAQVASVSFDQPASRVPLSAKGKQALALRDGSLIVVESVAVANATLSATSKSAGSFKATIKEVAQLWRPLGGETVADLQQRAAKLNISLDGNDAFLVRSPTGDWVVVPGLLEAMDKDEVVFAYAGQETTMPVESLAAILLAEEKNRQPAAETVRIHFRDGSIVTALTLVVDAENVTVTSVSLGKLTTPKAEVDVIRLRSASAVYLSDLTPVSVEQTSYFDDLFSWRRDESVTGRRLVLGGVSYERGLGLHARCRLVFILDGQYERLTAMAGIDDAVRSGQAVLSLLAEGKLVLERKLLSRYDSPQAIAVSVAGAKQIEVLVDFAPNSLGAGARVNLCNIRLINNR